MRGGQNEAEKETGERKREKKRDAGSFLVDFSGRRRGVNFPLRRHVAGSENAAAAAATALASRGMPVGVEEKDEKRGREE